MKPTFGGSGVNGTVADRINAMRERSGLSPLAPDQMDTEAITRQVQSDQGVGEYSDAETITYNDFEGVGDSEPMLPDGSSPDIPEDPTFPSPFEPPSSPAPAPGALPPKGLKKKLLPIFATKQWYLYNFLAPLPYFGYTAYKFSQKTALAAKCDAQKNFLSDECRAKDEIEKSEFEYDVPAGGSLKDVWTLYKKEALWAIVWSGIGAGITGYHAYKRGNDAKSIGMYSLLGASVPVLGIGLALMQGFPRYKGPGQTKRER